jgi:hypothetical protein
MKNKSESSDASRAKAMQNKYQAMSKSDDSFVKQQQMKTASMGGKAPNLKPEASQFNAYMCNNGEHAQDLARSLTSGLDKSAFPVK